MNEQTSLKGLFQGMIPESASIIMGKVISATPLKIQAINDDKLIIPESLICVPKHLSDYRVKCDIALSDGELLSETETSGAESVHSHSLRTFSLHEAVIKIYSALKTGETVYLLSINAGKNYYVLDREV